MHPDLAHAIVLAALAELPVEPRRGIASPDLEEMLNAEQSIAERIVLALAEKD